MNIKYIQILLTNGVDIVYLHTDLPEGTWPYQHNAVLKMDVGYDGAIEYVKEHFPNIECEVINTRTNRYEN